MRTLFLLVCILIFSSSCNQFEYSPSQAFDNNSYQNLNAKNLEILENRQSSHDTITFVVTGDTQRGYDQLEDLVRKVNSINEVDFLLIAGDISEFGVLQEMEWVGRSLQKLRVPFLAVIGNHDMVGRGRSVFRRMFGEFNYSFIYKGVKFICHDTNGREYNFDGSSPDLTWLEKELKPTVEADRFVAISHVPTISSDFDPDLIVPYTSLFTEAKGFLASFHAHTHVFSEFKYEGSPVQYAVTGNVVSKEFLLVKIINDDISYERVFY